MMDVPGGTVRTVAKTWGLPKSAAARLSAG